VAKQRKRGINPPRPAPPRSIPASEIRDEVDSAHAAAGLPDPLDPGNGAASGALTPDELVQTWSKVKQIEETARGKQEAAEKKLSAAEAHLVEADEAKLRAESEAR
jgi:hypothetical protein